MTRSNSTRVGTRRQAAPLAALLLVAAVGSAAAAQNAPVPSQITLVPTSDATPSGTCNEYTARVTGANDAPVQGVTVDVVQSLQDTRVEPDETRELAFCNPQNPAGPNPTGTGGASFGDVSGNNPSSTSGEAGRNTVVHGEVGPTDANGQVTFGITISPSSAQGTVTVTVWYEPEDDDELDAGEPSDSSQQTWVHSEDRPVVSLDASPESDTNPTGTRHTVTVVLATALGPAVGVVPSSVIVPNAFGRPAGDVANPNAGSSPNAGAGGSSAAYSCAASNAQGVSTCTFDDPAWTDQGTDSIVFYVDGAGGSPGPDANDPQDAVQKTWVRPPPPPPPNAEPDTDTNPVGTQHAIDVFTVATGEPVRADVLPGSANAQDQSLAEIDCAIDDDGQGTYECVYTGVNAGTDTIRVFVDSNDNRLFDQGERFDEVTKIWSEAGLAVSMTDGDSAPAGTCNEFTVRVTDLQGNAVVGQAVDVAQVLQGAGTEPDETRELAFCDPVNAAGPNPTGRGGTQLADVQGNNPGQTVGQAGRNTTVHAEVGPTGNNGEVTFGITINDVPQGQTATVAVRSWIDLGGDDDRLDGGEPTDTGVKTWTAGGPGLVTALNAEPEAATNRIGTHHQVTLTVTGTDGPVPGITPNGIVAGDAAGRPQGDVVNPNAGTSPNAAPGDFDAYACTPTNAQGVATCTFDDSRNPGPAGTDTVVFYVNRPGGTPGPDANEPQDAVQKTWTPAPPASAARNVVLCHDDAGAGCDTSWRPLSPGDPHEVAALVTDGAGTPVPGVRVELRETGPAEFTASGASSILVTTGADGVARAVLLSEHFGTSTIVAEIDPPRLAGSARGPAAYDDECEQPAGPGGSPPAGNCVSQTLTVGWEDIHPTICSDGVDNDGDGLVDYPEDPGCSGIEDDSETPVQHPDGGGFHDRIVHLRFDHARDGLRVFGRVRLDGRGGLRDCVRGRPVKVQRRTDGQWGTLKTASTNARGRFSRRVADATGRYRAVAVRAEILLDDELHVCKRAKKAKPHRHRR